MLGSWTAFWRLVSEKGVHQPAICDIWKCYRDGLNKIIDDCQFSDIFSHAEETVYFKFSQIIWTWYGNVYEKIFINICVLHQHLSRQKRLFKHGYLGYKDWLVHPGSISLGSSKKCSCHFYWFMKIFKELFDFLLQYHMGQLIDIYKNIDAFLPQSLNIL